MITLNVTADIQEMSLMSRIYACTLSALSMAASVLGTPVCRVGRIYSTESWKESL
jgi:hypothetical protein